VQTAIEEARDSATTTWVTSTSEQSTSSSTFQAINSMTLTPPAGTWLIVFNASMETSGVNCEAEICFAINGVAIGETVREIRTTAEILGLVTLSTNNFSSSQTIILRRAFTGSEVLTVRMRALSGGSIFAGERALYSQKVGL
jgi:hypothetical protein